MLEVFTHTLEDTALNSKHRLNRDSTVELILDPDSGGDVRDWTT
jgi:hypothetical protein